MVNIWWFPSVALVLTCSQVMPYTVCMCGMFVYACVFLFFMYGNLYIYVYIHILDTLC